jgi:hypothetical protein
MDSENVTSGYFYLQKGVLLYKPDAGKSTLVDLQLSDIVQAYWPVSSKNAASVCICFIEAVFVGADLAQVEKIKNAIRCTDRHMLKLTKSLGLRTISTNMHPVDPHKTLHIVFSPSFVNQKVSGVGFGDSIFNAMINFHYNLSAKYPIRGKAWGLPELIVRDINANKRNERKIQLEVF